jgi:DNA-binding transcriptional MerR regulator
VAQQADKLFKIGEVIRRTGFTRQQLHNFLTMGIITEHSRTPARHRLFGDEVFKRLSIIRGLLSQGYHLADIPRTFKAFLRVVLVCLLLGAGSVLARPFAQAGEAQARLSKADVSSIRALFANLRRMMLEGNASRVNSLLAPSVSQQTMHRTIEQLEAEFQSCSYTEFSCEFDEKQDIEVLGLDHVRVRVLIRNKYYERAQSAVPQGDEEGQSYVFDLVKADEGWRITDAPYFRTLYSTQDTILGEIFMIAAIALIVGSFWGWMFLDCCFRTWGGHKLLWVVAVGLVPGVGALAYFFVVWMRQGPED